MRLLRTTFIATLFSLVLWVVTNDHALCETRSSETLDFIKAEQADTILLEENVAFIGPGGEEIIFSVGTYRVEAVGQSDLRLVHLDKKAAFVIKAQPRGHAEDIGSPTALRVVDDEYQTHVVLLLPKQTGFEAIGSSRRGRHRGSIELLTPAQIHDALMQKKAAKP